jgi:hypothetical protein
MYLSGNGAAKFLEKFNFVPGLLRTAQTAQAKTERGYYSTKRRTQLRVCGLLVAEN